MSRFKGVWKLINSSLTTEVMERSSHTLNYVNGKLYVFGGEHDPRTPIDNDLHFYDLNNNSWNKIEGKSFDKSQIPCARVAHSSCVIKDKIYIFGGRVGVGMGEGSFNDLYEFDTTNNKWKALDNSETPNTQRPEKRSYHTMTSLNNSIYVFGGCAEGRLNDLYSYDIITGTWKRLPQNDAIQPRGGSFIGSFKTQEDEGIYVVGGFSGIELRNCFAFNVKTNNWSNVEDLPQELSVFAAAPVDDNHLGAQIIVHGGEIGPSKEGHKSAGQFSDATFVYDGKSWSKVDIVNNNKPNAIAWHHGSYGNSKFYIFGGMLENSTRVNQLWSLELSNA